MNSTIAKPREYIESANYSLKSWGRAHALLDPSGEMIAVVVYVRGAAEIVRRLVESPQGTRRTPARGICRQAETK